MVNYREILRMTADGYGIRQIRSDAHFSHDTIRIILEVAKERTGGRNICRDETDLE